MDVEDGVRTDNADEAMSQAVEKVRQLRQTIQKITASDEDEWFRNLLFGIINCALLDYYSVEVGAQKSIYLAAWGRRNLLELKVITTYVLASESNASNFRNELAIDLKEFYEALTKHHRASHKKLLTMLSEMSEQEASPMKEILEEVRRKESERGPETASTDAEAATYKQLMIDFGLKENAKPARAGDLARLISQGEEFDPMFKVCSKIMHRTVLSIASSITKGSLDAVVPILSDSSACDLLSIYGLIDEYFKRRGVRPPDN